MVYDPAGVEVTFAPAGASFADEIDLGTITTSRQVYSRGGLIYGLAVCESTGAAVAKVRIRDGHGIDGAVLFPIALAAGGTLILNPTDPGLRFQDGLYVEVVSGSVELVVHVGPLG